MTYDWNASEYDELLKDADKDNRVGDHLFMVTKVVHDSWPSGDPRIKIVGNLQSANNAKADLTISPPPAPDVVKAESKTWEQGKKRAIANTVNIYRQLAQHYSKSPDQIAEGDVFAVKTAKGKVDAEGKGGFIRVIAFLAKDKLDASTKAAAADAPPF
jgi:hypothetical protein